MKSKFALICSVLAVASAIDASAETRVFNFTGSTAFRSGSHQAIISILGGAGTTTYAYTGTSGISGANRSIFQGTMAAFPGDTIIIRCSWSGSTSGILSITDGLAIQYLDDVGNTLTTGGQRLGEAGDPAPVYENAVPRWSFSDVDKLLSTRPVSSVAGEPVGVVPFVFVAGEGSPAYVTNMTDQIHYAMWSTGFTKASLFSGDVTVDPAKIALATGRNNGSGTRATILSETGYGAFTSIVQFGATFQGERTDAFPTGKLLDVIEFDNSGPSSNSNIRDILTRSSADLQFGGNPVDAFFIGYLGAADATAAVTEGAKAMSYNGVAYSDKAVKDGSYTLWGYQQLYRGSSPTANELTVDAALRAAIPAVLTGSTAGIPLTEMNVQRSGGDGGPIFPN